MTDLLINKQSRQQLESYVKNPPHALLIIGPQGIGKYAVACGWAKRLAKNINITTVSPDEKGTIPIDSIRGLYRLTRAKQTDWQMVIIDHAEGMGIEAQNAFLKLLEEPRAGVTFVLTAPNPDSLLPTITSRVQVVNLLRAPQSDLQVLAKKLNPKITATELTQLLFVAYGRPATLVRLVSDTDEFNAAKDLMQKAKKLLTASTYERLCLITELTKTREDAINVLEAMTRMLHAQLLRDPSNSSWLKLSEDLQICLGRLAQNGNPRAQLVSLFANQ